MSRFNIHCLACQRDQPPHAVRCESCGGALGFQYDAEDLVVDARFDSMWRYWQLLPVESPDELVTLGEGGTPLLKRRSMPTGRHWLKDETRNPTGSHKDRPLAVALTHARRLRRGVSVVVSSGSTGIANAALSARAGIEAVVVVARGVPAPRVYPAFALGASVVEVDAEVDTIVERVACLGRSGVIYDSSTARSSNPYQAEGAKTIAYEVVEQLGDAPDWMVVPVGGGGTVAAIWRGFADLLRLGRIQRPPRLLGVVAAGYHAIEVALERGLDDPNVVFPPDHVAAPTILVKVAHVFPPDGVEGVAALRASGGAALVITDEDALAAQRRVGREEGLFVEPSSAAAIAGLDRAIELGMIDSSETVVTLLSGSGFRESFMSAERTPLESRAADIDELEAVLTMHDGEVAW